MLSRLVAQQGDVTMRLPDFAVTTTRRARVVVPRHAHEHTNLGFCLAGSFEETVGRRTVTAGPATLIGRPAGEPHANRYGSVSARCLIIELFPQAVTKLGRSTDLVEGSFVWESPLVTVIGRRIAAELRRRDDVTALMIESLLYELVAEVHRGREPRAGERRRPAWLERSVERLREAACRPSSIGLSSLADNVGVHPSHLARAFRREFGCTVGQFIRTLRLEEAARRLRANRLDIARVAFETGFADQSHLTRAFKRHFGVTPGQFRRLTTGS